MLQTGQTEELRLRTIVNVLIYLIV